MNGLPRALVALRGANSITEGGWTARRRSRDPRNQSGLRSVSGPYPDWFVSSTSETPPAAAAPPRPRSPRRCCKRRASLRARADERQTAGRPFTARSHHLSERFTETVAFQGNLLKRDEHTRDEQGRPALPLDRLAALEARGPARARPARVRHAARRGLRAGQASRDGLRDDHRPRHDRRRPADRRSPRRLRLRGADGVVQGRAPGGPRPLLRHHRRRPRVAAGARRRRRARGRVPARARDRLRAGAPVLRRRGAADPAPPPPPGSALRRVGDAQRLPRPRAQRARRGLHRDARRHRRRRLRRPRRRRHRAHVHRDARWPTPGTSCSGTCAPAARPPAASRAARPSGRTAPWRSRCARWGAARAARSTRARC